LDAGLVRFQEGLVLQSSEQGLREVPLHFGRGAFMGGRQAIMVLQQLSEGMSSYNAVGFEVSHSVHFGRRDLHMPRTDSMALKKCLQWQGQRVQYGLQQGAGGMRCVPCVLNSGSRMPSPQWWPGSFRLQCCLEQLLQGMVAIQEELVLLEAWQRL